MLMILITHMVLAFMSIIFASFACISPSVKKLRLTYFTTVAMFVSGAYLTIQNMSHLLESCAIGLIVLSVIVAQVSVAQKQLHQSENK